MTVSPFAYGTPGIGFAPLAATSVYPSVPTAALPIGGDALALSAPSQNLASEQQTIAKLQIQLAAIARQLRAITAALAAPAPAQPKKPAPAPTKPAPRPTKPAPKPAPRPSSYTVRPGDTLSSIAARTLGSASRWKEIYDLNRGSLSDPDTIFPGQRLELPTGSKPKAPSAPTKPSHGPNTNRSQIYMMQPNDWTCGPTSLTMAAASFGLRKSDVATVDEMVRRTGATPSTGIPNHDAIPNAAHQIGLQCTPAVVSTPAKVRAALQQGHGVIQDGSLGTGGHYIYLAGLNPNGTFIVFDPARSTQTAWTDADLEHFIHTNPGHDVMFQVWK